LQCQTQFWQTDEKLEPSVPTKRGEKCFYLFRLRLSRLRKKSTRLGPPIAFLL